MTFHAILHCSPWTFFFFHINTIFICFPSVKPWAHHFGQAAWGVTGKGTYRADTGERTMGGGKSSFTSWRRWARPPSGKTAHSLWEGQAHGVEELLFQRRVPSITVMKLPNTVPLPAQEPATPAVATPAPGNLAAVSESCEMILVWKLWLRISEMAGDPGLPSCCGSHGSVSLVLHHLCGQWSLNRGNILPIREG